MVVQNKLMGGEESLELVPKKTFSFQEKKRWGGEMRRRRPRQS
jgi:hypothetical protein